MARWLQALLLCYAALTVGLAVGAPVTDESLTTRPRRYTKHQIFDSIGVPDCALATGEDPPSVIVDCGNGRNLCMSNADGQQIYYCQWNETVGAGAWVVYGEGVASGLVVTGDPTEIIYKGPSGLLASPDATYDSATGETRTKIINGVRDLASYATSGTGSSGAPWKGWQAAIATGVAVKMKPGYYDVENSGIALTGMSDVTIEGDGPGAVLVDGDATATTMIDVGTCNRCTIRNLLLDGKSNLKSANANGINVDGGDSITVENVTFRDIPGSCVRAVSTSGTADNLLVRGIRTEKVNATTYACENKTTDNPASSGGYGFGIILENTPNTIITDSRIIGSEFTNVYLALGADGTAITKNVIDDCENCVRFYSDRVRVEGNQITNSRGDGVRPGDGSDDWVIVGNVIKDHVTGSASAIRTEGTSTQGLIANNFIYNVGRAIYVWGNNGDGTKTMTDLRVEANVVDTCSATCIAVNPICVSCVVANNSVSNGGGSPGGLGTVAGSSGNSLFAHGNVYRSCSETLDTAGTWTYKDGAVSTLGKTTISTSTSPGLIVERSADFPAIDLYNNDGSPYRWRYYVNSSGDLAFDQLNTSTLATIVNPIVVERSSGYLGLLDNNPDYNLDITCSSSPCVAAQGGNIGTSGVVQIGSITVGSATCVATSSDRLYHDTDCDNTKDAGEEYWGVATSVVLTGSTTDAVDLGTAEVAGDLPLSNIVQIATDRLLGRDTAGTGDLEALTVGGGIEFTNSGGIQRSALTGDVTATAGGSATTIATSAVTSSKVLDGTIVPGDMDLTQAYTFAPTAKVLAVSVAADYPSFDLKDTGATPSWWRLQSETTNPGMFTMVGSSTGTALNATSAFNLRQDGLLTLSGNQATLILTDDNASTSPFIRWNDTAGTAQVWELYGDDTSWRLTNATGSTTPLTVTRSTGAVSFAVPLADAQVSDTLTASLFSGSGSTTTAVDLATAEVFGVLPVANGGTNASSFTTNTCLRFDGTRVVSASGDCVAGGGTGDITSVGTTTSGAVDTITIQGSGAAVAAGVSLVAPTAASGSSADSPATVWTGKTDEGGPGPTHVFDWRASVDVLDAADSTSEFRLDHRLDGGSWSNKFAIDSDQVVSSSHTWSGNNTFTGVVSVPSPGSLEQLNTDSSGVIWTISPTGTNWGLGLNISTTGRALLGIGPCTALGTNCFMELDNGGRLYTRDGTSTPSKITPDALSATLQNKTATALNNSIISDRWECGSSVTCVIDPSGTPSYGKRPIISSDGSTVIFAQEFSLALYGDGSDGTGTFDGSSTPSCTTKSGNDYTFTRDCYFTSFTISSGVTVNVAGYRTFASGTGTINSGGFLQAFPQTTVNGGAATGTTGGTAGVATSATTVGSSAAGGTGQNGDTGAGTASGTAGGLNARAEGGAGGTGGRGGDNATTAKAGGTLTAFKFRYPAMTSQIAGGAGNAGFVGSGTGGGGGTSGQGDGTNKGGGGGGGGASGGALMAFVRYWAGSGTISVKGGNGGAGANGAGGTAKGGGGGAGGGGGWLYLITDSDSIPCTIVKTGGTGGAAGTPAGTSPVASAGANGADGFSIMFNRMTGAVTNP